MRTITKPLTILVIAVFLNTGFSSVCTAGKEPFTRIGFSIGSTRLMGVYIERVYEDHFIRAEGGFLFSALGVSITANRYFSDDPWRPYLGGGFLHYRNVFSKEYLNLLIFPWGVDYKIDSRNWVSFELNSCIPLSRESDVVPSLYRELLIPIPAFNYKYRVKMPSQVIP